VSAYRGALLTLNAHVAGIAILLVGIGITTLCVILWIGHVTGIKPISGRIAWGIWITLIASFLGTTAAAYKTVLTFQQPATIEKFILLDESAAAPTTDGGFTLNDVQARTNNYYTIPPATKTRPIDVVIAFGAVVSGFQRDAAGNFNVKGEVSLSTAGGELQDVGPLPIATNDNYFQARPIIQKLGKPKVEQILGSGDGKILYVQVLAKFPAAVLDKGPKTLRLEITDAKSSACSEATQSLVFR